MRKGTLMVLLAVLAACSSKRPGAPGATVPDPRLPQARTAISADGLRLAYTVQGAGEVALLFIHGGFTDQRVWRNQVGAFADRYRVVTLDLGGHGESGKERAAWTVASLADDVIAVVETERLQRVVLVGNSMGAPVALEAAARLPGRVVGVIGVDTLHKVDEPQDQTRWQARVAAFRTNFAEVCPKMVSGLFHPGADPTLVAEVKATMCSFPAETAAAVLEAFTGYDLAGAMSRAGVPVRSVNGDLYPTDVAANRKYEPTYDAVIMPGAGHLPMLEQPEEFNRILDQMVADLVQPKPR